MRIRVSSLLGMLLLTACGLGLEMSTEPTADIPVIVEENEYSVVAEGVVEPSHQSTLGFRAAGEVFEVLVEEGDTVAAGDVLLRLDQAHARLAARQAEAELEVAEAQLAFLMAGVRPEEVAAAEARVKAAQGAVKRAAAERDILLSGASEAEISAASAEVARANAQRKVAQDAYDADPPDEELASLSLDAADRLLMASQARLDKLRAGPDRALVRAAEAALSVAYAEEAAAQAQLVLAEVGPTDQEIALAEVDVARARVALETARAKLRDTEVRAPFGGTVTTVGVEVGNTLMPGQPAVTLAGFEQFRVRTKDLSELDVTRIEVGQLVKATVDGLPGREFDGMVRHVALQAGDFRGESVFPVTVDLLDVGDAPLRWGMTAWVEFDGP